MKTLTKISNTIMEKYLPDPYIFVAILTVLVLLLGVGLTDSSPLDMVIYWGDGFWGLLSFTMQMVIVLAAGHILANSPLFKKFLSSMASKIKKPSIAIIVVTFISLIGCWINWGFGLVIGALFAKEIARQVKKVDYRLLIASAYSGFVIWHGGLAGSIPLSIATDGHPFSELMGVVPTSGTIFTPYNLFIVLTIGLTLPFFNRWMMPKEEDVVEVDPALLEEETQSFPPAEKTFASWTERSTFLTILIGLIGLSYLIYHFVTKGFSLDLNVVNTIFIILGIIFHGTPQRFLAAAQQAIKTTTGIVFQFPFYAGIMGMMTASGLAIVFSEWFINISNDVTFYLFTFYSAGLVNFFVPSGGGQWAVQAPIMLEAAQTMGADYAKTAMAIAWGDAWTNMIQPFWALPALAIAGLKAKDIMGFCLFVLIFTGIIISVGFLLF
ncbi:short-chain fatty acid transporter [Ureibacillus sp. 179-F W5.1 NHS]|uniref:Short-chain fatty acid transporter n=1 Tax=Lysinibacillus halotolerans TaxID=1368476 RepID=A0A3M8H2N0_9BACI|nr:short-chain fatty acid transporter [Lysinibacillus halotolerans]RNC96314.1 short-chain fatty acid transporter [Lysinibacillus halotolerans]